MTKFVPTHKKRLQVFISSTFADLREERQAAVEAILTAGHIPAGMELFTAGDVSQMEVIKQWIDESDVFMLILGSRYGSIEPTTGKSYIHIEYDYAVAKGKPVFATVLDDGALDERVRRMGASVMEHQKPQALREFRESVCSRMVRFWTDAKDIKLTVHETMAQFSRAQDLRGWIRAPDDIGTPVGGAQVWTNRRKIAPEIEARIQAAKKCLLFVGFSFESLFKDYPATLANAMNKSDHFTAEVLMLHPDSLHVPAHQPFSTRPVKSSIENVIEGNLKSFFELLTPSAKKRFDVRLTHYLPRFAARIFDDEAMLLNFYLYHSKAAENPVIELKRSSHQKAFDGLMGSIKALFSHDGRGEDRLPNTKIIDNGKWAWPSRLKSDEPAEQPAVPEADAS